MVKPSRCPPGPGGPTSSTPRQNSSSSSMPKELYEVLAPPRAGIPLPHRRRKSSTKYWEPA
eukprot:58393-Pyramimonas_sp.AAC.1